MKTVLDVLKRVGATSSKKEKEAILKVALPSNELLRRVAQYALNQGQSYNLTGIVKDKTGRTTFCLEHSRMPHLGAAFVETRFSEKEVADDLAYCQQQLVNA